MKDDKIKNIIGIILSSIIVSSIIPLPALASPKEDLEQTQKDMEEAKAKQDELAEQTGKLEDELKALQQKLVTHASATQEAESGLTDAEDKLGILDEQLKAKQDAFDHQQKNLAALVRAGISLSQNPPEAMAMLPGDSVQTMQAARTLKMTAASIKEEAHSLSLQMAELQKMKRKVSAERNGMDAQQAALDKEQKALEHQLAERKALRDQLGSEQKEQAEKLAQLAKKSEDLQGLVASLEKQEAEARAARKEKSQENKGKLRSFESAQGQVRMPVAGKVVRAFGAPDEHNSTSKGLVIKVRGRAQVTAPFDGEVVFTGPFLAYGQMVIIKHSDGFHTLLAGLSKIDVDVGQFLLEGEPIGAMGDSSEGTRLYVELRKNNQPVNPATYLKMK